MESQHMTQQVFAQFINISPATLSGIFNGRTNPSLNIVEAIKQKLPAISTDWLLFGRGQMYLDTMNAENDAAISSPSNASGGHDQILDFSPSPTTPSEPISGAAYRQGVTGTPKNTDSYLVKNIDKPQRRITEIRIFFDDQTFESFVPKK